MKQAYRVKRDDAVWLAGRRIAEDRTIALTAEEAEPLLARDLVEPAAPQAATRPKSKAAD